MRPDQARTTEVATVFKADTPAAVLRRTSDGVIFSYLPSYAGRPVASTLPVGHGQVITASGAVPPFFAGLLPEGARLDAVIRAVKTSADDELSLLLAVGADTVGDVTIVPEGGHPADPTPRDTVDPSTVSFRDLFARSVDPGADALDTAIPGVQDKLSHSVISFPLSARSGPCLLKLSPTGFPLLVENEAFFLRMAKSIGFRVPRHEVVRDRDGETGLLVERFDRAVAADGTVTRLQQEDACQIAGRWPADKYRLSMREVVEAVSTVVSSPAVAALDLTLQVAYAALIANGDLHAKNISVRWLDQEDLVEVTPVYDVLTTRPYPVDHRMALAVDGRNNRIRGRDLVAFATRHGVPERLTSRRLAAMLDRVEPLIPSVAEVGFDERTTETLVTEMRTRLAYLRT